MAVKLSATSREPEEWAAATELARRTRENIGEQIKAIVMERDGWGSRSEVALRVRHVVDIEKRIEEAMGREEQARQMGLPVSEHVEAQKEGREALRSAVMELAAASAAWVAAIDHEHVAAAQGRISRNGETPLV